MAAVAQSPRSPSASKRRLLTVGVALVVLLGAGGAAWYFLNREAAPVSTLPAPAQYMPMSPAFVVNLDETPVGPRYLQVEVQLVTRDPLAVATLKQHEPAIRARLLMLFAQQTYDGVSTREGKEALQAKALEEVRTLMVEETGTAAAESLLFTSFVTQ